MSAHPRPLTTAAENASADDVYAFPASRAQQRLWFLDQLGFGSAAYNIPSAFRLAGRLDVAALRRALDAVVARHESLRTTFTPGDGRPLQLVAPERRQELPVVDLTSLPPARREEEARRLATEDASRPFDLSRGPLFRTTLLALAPDEHVLVLSMHHTISDGWSVGILASELEELYGAHSQGRRPRLAPLPIQYADYAQWETEWLLSPAGRSQLAYWKARLADAPRPAELPLDRPRPAAPSFRGGLVPFALDAEVTRSLKELSRARGATLFMTLLAGFAALVSRLSGEEDVAIGSMAANRGVSETEPLVGFFVNALVYRMGLEGDPSFEALVSRAREVALGAYANQQLPFERLVEELRPERDLARNPLFGLCLTLQNPPFALRLPGLAVTPIAAENQTAKFDVSLEMWEGDGGVLGRLEYASDLFDETTITALAARYRRLLAAAAARPSTRLSELPLLSDEDRRAALVAPNGTAAPFDETPVHRHVEERARETPRALAVAVAARRATPGAGSSPGLHVTYAELNARANRVAHTLIARSVAAETPVAILAGRSVELVAGALGVLKAGGAYVPLDPAAPRERTRFLLEDSGARVVLADARLASLLDGLGADVILLDGRGLARDESDPGVAVSPSQLAYVIYTSGSTGTPKGVEVEHRALANLVAWHREAYGVTAKDRATLVASPAFDASVWETWPYLAAGASLHVPGDDTRDDPCALKRWLASERVTIAFLPTPLAEAFLSDPSPSPALRALLTGGDRLHGAPADLPFALVNHYGPTEATVVSTAARVAPGSERPPIGRPIANLEIAVLDAAGRPVPPGVPGELFVGGAGLARGYRGRPELTAERFVPCTLPELRSARLYRTGDLVRLLPGGDLEFLGRTDAQVKIRGVRVEPAEVEGALARIPGVRECAVVARGEGALARLVAYVVSEPPRAGRGGAPDAASLRRALAESLPPALVPSAFVTLPALPKTTSGKLDRRALPEPPAAPVSSAAYAGPGDGVEARLAAVWEEVLGVSPIGLDANYFEMGGHSLLAARLFARIEKEFSRALPLATIFQAPTVRQLAELLREKSWRPTWSSLVPIQPDGGKTPFYCIHAVGGNVLTYADLARHLPPDQPVWGLQARGLDGKQPLPDTLEEMAARYLEEIRQLQPRGPYLLGGSSAGGLVAYEMAQQLAAAGQEVGLLALFDTWGPDYPRRIPGTSPLRQRVAQALERVDLHVGNLMVADGMREKLRYVATKAQRLVKDAAKLARRRARRLRQLLEDLAHPLPRALRRVEREGRRAVDVYEVKPYRGKVTLFRASKQPSGFEPDPELGWGRVALSGVDVHEVPGYHGAIVYEPRVRVLAERLRAILDAPPPAKETRPAKEPPATPRARGLHASAPSAPPVSADPVSELTVH